MLMIVQLEVEMKYAILQQVGVNAEGPMNGVSCFLPELLPHMALFMRKIGLLELS